MRRRREIGRFKRSKQGGWEGEINTLTIHRKVRLVPNDNRRTDRDPTFRVMLGWQHIGDAWERQARSDPPRDYVRGEIDDPLCPIVAALFPDAEGLTAPLIWSDDPSVSRQQFRQPIAGASGPAATAQRHPTSS